MTTWNLGRLIATGIRRVADALWHGRRRLAGGIVAGAAMLLPLPALATLVSIGPDAGFVPRSLTSLSSPVPMATLGNGSLAFNGGLVFDAASSRLFGIANDSFGNSQLYSFTVAGAALTALGSGLGQGFYGGLAQDPSTGHLYAVADDMFGGATLYAISSAGAATALGAIGNGYFGGPAWAGDTLYAIAGDALGVQRSVYAIDPATVTASLLFSLGDGSLGFNGGLAYDDMADLFYTIGNDAFGNSALYAFTAGGAGADLAALGAPFGQGFVNAGLAIVPGSDPPQSLPESPTLALALLALGLACFLARPGRRRNST
ncbi:hypothetical protein [Roseateles sp.]|uniref:hypothetical protein n=1 Tax=Roseateles sp. TaxID=1971397 RepID=UPI0025EB3B72|nr:hypothetical protein [Roseateles sp.]MBV8037123.1 hypothetical protein [Roseateles sp.]